LPVAAACDQASNAKWYCLRAFFFGEPIVAGRIIEVVDNQYRQPNESPQTEQAMCVRLGDGRFEERSSRVFSLSTTLEQQHITCQYLSFDFDVEQ
jgi:hypothetical protein